MTHDRTAGYAALILRLASGTAFVTHGLGNLLNMGFDGTGKYLAYLHLPPQLAYVVIPLEILGGIALIIGLHIRTLTVILGTELLVVAFAGHLNLKAHFSVNGFSWEYPVYWGLSMFALALLGDGVYSVDNIRFRRKGTA